MCHREWDVVKRHPGVSASDVLGDSRITSREMFFRRRLEAQKVPPHLAVRLTRQATELADRAARGEITREQALSLGEQQVVDALVGEMLLEVA